jgi:hypothetical protein
MLFPMTLLLGALLLAGAPDAAEPGPVDDLKARVAVNAAPSDEAPAPRALARRGAWPVGRGAAARAGMRGPFCPFNTVAVSDDAGAAIDEAEDDTTAVVPPAWCCGCVFCGQCPVGRIGAGPRAGGPGLGLGFGPGPRGRGPGLNRAMWNRPVANLATCPFGSPGLGFGRGPGLGVGPGAGAGRLGLCPFGGPGPGRGAVAADPDDDR